MRLMPKKKMSIVGTHCSLSVLLGVSDSTANELSAWLESSGYYPPLFTRAACAKFTCIESNKWHLWTQKQAFRGVTTQPSYHKNSINVVPFARRQQLEANNSFAQELMAKLDSYGETEKAPQLRLAPQPDFVQNHTFVPGMSQQRKDKLFYTPPAPRPLGF